MGLQLLTVDLVIFMSMHQNTIAASPALCGLRGLSEDSHDDPMLMACDIPNPQRCAPANTPLQPQPLPPSHAGDQNEHMQPSLSQLPVTGNMAGFVLFFLLPLTDF